MAVLAADPAGNPPCDFCGQPAVAYETEIKDGRTTLRRLCAQHAAEAGHGDLLQRDESAAEVIVRNLRRTANFIRAHGRMPTSVVELAETAEPNAPLPVTDITDPALRRFLHTADAMLRFYDAHGRLPSGSQEMQPPGP